MVPVKQNKIVLTKISCWDFTINTNQSESFKTKKYAFYWLKLSVVIVNRQLIKIKLFYLFLQRESRFVFKWAMISRKAGFRRLKLKIEKYKVKLKSAIWIELMANKMHLFYCCFKIFYNTFAFTCCITTKYMFRSRKNYLRSQKVTK